MTHLLGIAQLYDAEEGILWVRLEESAECVPARYNGQGMKPGTMLTVTQDLDGHYHVTGRSSGRLRRIARRLGQIIKPTNT